jgi:hypothetical protein
MLIFAFKLFSLCLCPLYRRLDPYVLLFEHMDGPHGPIGPGARALVPGLTGGRAGRDYGAEGGAGREGRPRRGEVLACRMKASQVEWN